MRGSVALLLGVMACSRAGGSESAAVASASSQAPADAGAPADATRAEAVTATADAAPRRSCDDLTADEKRALEGCAISSFGAALGQHGAFTARVEVSGGATRVRTENDIEHVFRAPPPGSACARAGELLAPLAPCTWDVRGPFPAWSIKTVKTD